MKTHHTLPTALTALTLLACAMLSVAPAGAQAAGCPNEQFRIGASVSLPNCRAYELVTPEHLGRSQDIPFTVGNSNQAVASPDGERFALKTFSRLEPGPALYQSYYVFSRTPQGWTIKSAVAPGAEVDNLELFLASPDLTQVGLSSFSGRLEPSPTTFEVGPVGGPYTPLAEVPEQYRAGLVGANAGTASVPAFSDVVLDSNDPALLPAGSEPNIPGADETYDWSEGQLRRVAVDDQGKPLSRCGSQLGSHGDPSNSGATPENKRSVSADGSKIFFTTGGSGPNCEEPGSLYMRVENRETVEISAPQGVKLEPSERERVTYLDATANGSKVFFSTNEALTEDAPNPGPGGLPNLYVYETGAPAGERLKFVANGVSTEYLTKFVVSEDGTVIYARTSSGGGYRRYDTVTGENSLITTGGEAPSKSEAAYATPNGEFFVFTSDSIENEPRIGHGHQNGLFWYDNADKSIICVSCGGTLISEGGEMDLPLGGFGSGGSAFLESNDETPEFVDMSDNGQEVFFQTTAKLVPQDTNSTEFPTSTSSGAPGEDVYEWEADGWEGCQSGVGCTYLLSGGDDAGPAVFIDATANGSNVFFASPSQLVSWATPEFTNIYDARVDGGFAPPPTARECLSCQGVGSPAPLFGPGASLTFVGPGNAPSVAGVKPGVAIRKKPVAKCAKGKKRSSGRCVVRHEHKGKKKHRAKKIGSVRS
jgi:hypothetical protein